MKTIVSGWIEDFILKVSGYINDFKVETRFISGSFLIGMEFMAMASSKLVLDFENEHLNISKRIEIYFYSMNIQSITRDEVVERI